MNVLLVIDLQKEFQDSKGMYSKVLNYIHDNRDNYYYIVGTLFQNKEDSPFVKVLNWNGCLDSNQSSLDYHPDICITKTGYGLDVSKLSKDVHYDIIGCDSDACVMATCFNLWDAGYNFTVLSDYIYTTAKDYDSEIVIKQLKRNFGNCVK